MKDSFNNSEDLPKTQLQEVIFGGGCFWCTEAVFQKIEGVASVISGYCGGFVNNPTYKQICEGNTGHAEVIKVIYDSSKVSFLQILKVFFETHDPTTLNRQGNDVGNQYRSVVFSQNNEEKNTTLKLIESLNNSQIYNGKIVTTVEEFEKFFPAEDYHQNYYNRNQSEGYCRIIIKPKIEKLEHNFDHLMKLK
jgi:peptide-methionine (S)-S-oxide reductase